MALSKKAKTRLLFADTETAELHRARLLMRRALAPHLGEPGA